MTTSRSKLVWVTALVAALLLSTAACGDDDNGDDSDPDELDVYAVEIIDRSDDSVVANTHGDHWDGQILLDINAEEHRSLGFRFLNEDEEEIHLHLGEDGYSYEISGYDDSVIYLDTHSDHFHIEGEELGDTQLFFEFFQDGDTIHEAAQGAGLSAVVYNPDDDEDYSHIYEVEIIDRSDDSVIADAHGAHWHGQIVLDVTSDEHRSLGFRFLDAEGDEIDVPLGGAVDYDISGYDDSLIEIDTHSDHFHIWGDEVGETEVIFDFLQDSESVHSAASGDGLPVVIYDPTDETDLSDIEELEIIDRSDDSVIAEVHGDHWDGQILLEVDDPDHRSLGFRFLDAAGQEVNVPLGTDGLSYEITGYDSTMIDIDTHSDHFHIWGTEVGQTEVVFEFFEDSTSFYHADDGLPVIIGDPDASDGELTVDSFALLDRAHDPHAEIADIHDLGGSDPHWDGDFSDGIVLTENSETIEAGSSDWYERGAAGDQPEAVSLGAEVWDDEGEEVNLDDSAWYRLEAVHAHSEDEDVVYITESHGDHVHFVGREAGSHAHVIFQIVATDEHPDHSEGEVVFESPEFEFDVITPGA